MQKLVYMECNGDSRNVIMSLAKCQKCQNTTYLTCQLSLRNKKKLRTFRLAWNYIIFNDIPD